jgi:hypothetical protein
MRRIALLMLLASAAVAQNHNPGSAPQTNSMRAGREVTSRMPVSCVVAPSAVVNVPLIVLNTNDLQARRPQQASPYPQIYRVPMMPNSRMTSLASLVTVNNKTAVQSDDLPFTISTEKHDKYIYFAITF